MTTKPNISPRVVNQTVLARYLGKSKGWLSMHLNRLLEEGMPEKLPYVDGYDLKAIDKWLDSLGNMSSPLASNDKGKINSNWDEAVGRFK